MAFLWKNLVKSISNLRHVCNSTRSFYFPKRHHIFKSAVVGGEKYNTVGGEKFLLRRIRSSGPDERRYFSDLSHNSYTSNLTGCQHEWDSDFGIHCSRATTQFTALSSENDSFSTIQDLNNFPSFHRKRFVGSCRGLVCFDDGGEGAVFWNPSTNETKLLPPSDLDRPTKPNVVFKSASLRSGFRFDSNSQSHKYIRWVSYDYREGEEKDECEDDDFYVLVEVYCLKSDSWIRISNATGDGWCAYSRACVNGDFYWSTQFFRPTEILKYEFGTNRFTFLPFPNTGKHLDGTHQYFRKISDSACAYKLCDYGGSLGIIVYSRKLEKKSFQFWVWKGWWTKEFDVELAAERPLGFSKSGEFLFLVGLEYQLLVYNVATKDLTDLDIYCNSHVFDLIPFPFNNPNPPEEEEGAQCAGLSIALDESII